MPLRNIQILHRRCWYLEVSFQAIASEGGCCRDFLNISEEHP